MKKPVRDISYGLSVMAQSNLSLLKTITFNKMRIIKQNISCPYRRKSQYRYFGLFDNIICNISTSENDTREAVWEAYNETAQDCYIAGAMYVAVLIFAGWQMAVNSNNQYQVA